MERIRQQIKQWREGQLLPQQNDVLYNLTENKNAHNITSFFQYNTPFYINENAFLRNCAKQNRLSIKETGSPIFGIIKHILVFTLDNQTYRMPFLLATASLSKNKFNAMLIIHQSEDFYCNPLLLKTLAVKYLPLDLEEVTTLLTKKGLSVEAEQGVWVANFHPHRFVLQKEWEELEKAPVYSNPLVSLFGETLNKNTFPLSSASLFPTDESQQNAIAEVEKEDIVLQGPPGTGKSQVIATLIGKGLGASKSTLLVAEKKVALSVIYDQLKKKDLHYFCVLYHHELYAKNFISSLKKTWNHLEEIAQTSIVVGEQSQLLKRGLDLTFERLRQPDLIGGISYADFYTQFSFSHSEETQYLTHKPSLPIWKKDNAILQQLRLNQFPIFGACLTIKNHSVSLTKLEEIAEKGRKLLQNIKCSSFHLSDLKEKQILSSLVHLFFYDDRPLPLELFTANSPKQKKFKNLYSQLKTVGETEEKLRIEEKHWKKTFSLSELEEYILAMASTSKLSIHSWKVRRRLERFTDLDLTVGVKALENLVELKEAEREKIKLKEALRKLDFPDELPILNHIDYVIHKLESVDHNRLVKLFELTEVERLEMKEAEREINLLYQQLNTYFILSDDQSIARQLEQFLREIPQIAENRALLHQLSAESISVLRKTSSIKEAEHAIVYSHNVDFKGQYPDLAKKTDKDLLQKIQKIISVEDTESDAFASAIKQRIKQQFEDYHQLLQTPASKLTEAEKEIKKTLRKGKSILVKAFNKKRVFPSVRELMSSEAQLWIRLLHPIYLCSPYSVAKSIPIDWVFDFVIFDEASQIPLSHAVGALHRAKRGIIAGDQQQMAPHFYFQKKGKQQPDVLSHASYYWKNAMLSHHYRSHHPDLIAFSNRYFYNNQLQTFPTFKVNNPIDLITTNGIFEDRVNKKEAQLAAALIEEKLNRKEYNFGLVAFSQSQLQAILDYIPATYHQLMEDKDGIFIQSLENVQGDQCEHLIISMGYAKNREGKFYKRFGPLNQEQGHRRLNVLLSRAIAKITFFRSVTSSDFSISDNEGIELLRKLMLFLEEDRKETHFDWEEHVHQENNILYLSSLFERFSSATEAVDFYRTYSQRGWKISSKPTD